MKYALAIVMLVATSTVLAQPVAVAPKHFDHADHSKRNVDVTKCEDCHRTDAKGTIMAPAAIGHAPCMKCHADKFLAVGTNEAKRKPGEALDKATAFCTGCHAQTPVPWKKAATRVLPSFDNAREYHVELNHFAHASRAGDKNAMGCRGCHIVDGTTFALVTGTPGHGQCVTCHNPTDYPDFTMAQCGLCHQNPNRETYFQQQLEARGVRKKAPRPDSRVRSCGSEAHTKLAAKNPKTPCFMHERAEHRTDENNQPLQCAKCHYVVADKVQGEKYRSLVDLRVRPIIDNNKDRQHASCGRSGCHHANQVKADSCAEGYCHADMSVY